FFFQAEDGIRDFHVTGVQTCALPISPSSEPAPEGCASWPAGRERAWRVLRPARGSEGATLAASMTRFPLRVLETLRRHGMVSPEIGRASCRERGAIYVCSQTLNKAK